MASAGKAPSAKARGRRASNAGMQVAAEPKKEAKSAKDIEKDAQKAFLQRSATTKVAEPLEGDHYKVGNWDNRNTYFPVLQWAGESSPLQQRFKDLVEARNMQQIRILLHSGVSPNLPLYPLRRTALHRAAEMGDELLCQLLLSFKADPMVEDESQGAQGFQTAKDIAKKNQSLQLTHLFNAHLGKSELLDVGPNAGPLRSDKPIRIHLKAYEPCFMSSK